MIAASKGGRLSVARRQLSAPARELMNVVAESETVSGHAADLDTPPPGSSIAMADPGQGHSAPDGCRPTGLTSAAATLEHASSAGLGASGDVSPDTGTTGL